MEDNTLMDIKRFLERDAAPISMAEFKEFWDALSEEEKQEIKTTELPE